MADKTLIARALSQLDPANDAHWTGDGAPRMDVLHGMTGDSAITRAEVTSAAPSFTRAALQAGKTAAELLAGETPPAAAAAQPAAAAVAPGADPAATTVAATIPEGPKSPELEGEVPEGFDLEAAFATPATDFAKNPALLEAAMKLASDKAIEAAQARDELDQAVTRLAQFGDGLDRIRKNVARLRPKDAAKPVQGYLAAQNKVRADKIALRNRAAALMAPAGTPVAPVDAARAQAAAASKGVRPVPPAAANSGGS